MMSGSVCLRWTDILLPLAPKISTVTKFLMSILIMLLMVHYMFIIFKDVSFFLFFIFIYIHEVARILEVPENAELSCTEMA